MSTERPLRSNDLFFLYQIFGKLPGEIAADLCKYSVTAMEDAVDEMGAELVRQLAVGPTAGPAAQRAASGESDALRTLKVAEGLEKVHALCRTRVDEQARRFKRGWKKVQDIDADLREHVRTPREDSIDFSRPEEAVAVLEQLVDAKKQYHEQVRELEQLDENLASFEQHTADLEQFFSVVPKLTPALAQQMQEMQAYMERPAQSPKRRRRLDNDWVLAAYKQQQQRD